MFVVWSRKPEPVPDESGLLSEGGILTDLIFHMRRDRVISLDVREYNAWKQKKYFLETCSNFQNHYLLEHNKLRLSLKVRASIGGTFLNILFKGHN